MKHLHKSRCLNHPDREAIARCPECKHYFCQECITEYEHRILCAACIKTLVKKRKQQKEKGSVLQKLKPLALTFRIIFSLFLLLLFFYTIGWILLQNVDSFHHFSNSGGY